jgi:CspA family cold shock protein
MPTGTVTYFDARRGFGFVAADGPPGADTFVHARALEQAGIRELRVGDRISYEVQLVDRGAHRGKEQAQNVKLLARCSSSRTAPLGLR